MASAEPQITITRGHACITCSQRKVKCDGKRPCSSCVRTGRASDCHSASTPTSLAARIRDARAKELVLLRRLRHYENLLTTHGISFSKNPELTPAGNQGDLQDDSSLHMLTQTLDLALDSSPKPDAGHVIKHGGHPRFVDNLMWNSLRDELPDDEEYTPVIDGTDDELTAVDENGSLSPEILLFNHVSPSIGNPEQIGPSLPQILKLWQIFLDNFNPLVKLFHAPSVQLIIHQAVVDSGSLGKSEKALLCAIYQCAVITLTDEECMAQLNEPRGTLFSRYSLMTQQALVQTGFLKSTDLTSLQAFTLYLLAMRGRADAQTQWIHTGMAGRLGQAMGLHREQSLKNCSPFEAELRRRLWWHIVVSDHQAGRIIGVSTRDIPAPYMTDTKHPVNINDSDLYPEMKEPPVSRNYPTEMIFCAVRHEVGLCITQLNLGVGPPSQSQTLAQKLGRIDECEQKINAMLTHCDLSIPLHLMATVMGRSAVGQLRFNTLHSAARSSNDTTPETSGRLFGLALGILEELCRCLSTPNLKRFLWHMRTVHPFQYIIFVLKQLLARPDGDEVPRAWAIINRIYQLRPDFVNDVKNPLFFALGSLVLKAWNKCSQAGTRQGLVKSEAIAELEKQRTPTIDSRTPGPEVDSVRLDCSFGGLSQINTSPSQTIPRIVGGRQCIIITRT
ncbi:C6 transcription factor domain containing protein [Naviculisporaceae sp. PSN 640]